MHLILTLNFDRSSEVKYWSSTLNQKTANRKTSYGFAGTGFQTTCKITRNWPKNQFFLENFWRTKKTCVLKWPKKNSLPDSRHTLRFTLKPIFYFLNSLFQIVLLIDYTFLIKFERCINFAIKHLRRHHNFWFTNKIFDITYRVIQGTGDFAKNPVFLERPVYWISNKSNKFYKNKRAYIAESFSTKNFGDIGKFGNIGTFGDIINIVDFSATIRPSPIYVDRNKLICSKMKKRVGVLMTSYIFFSIL
jgi:hypothetical protein